MLFLFVAILATSCNAQDTENSSKNSSDLESQKDSLLKPKGTWKVNKEVDENGNSLAGEREGEVIALGKLDYNWQISDSARFTQLVSVEYGDTNTKTRSESAILAKINGSLQMKVAYNITHNSDVADDKENTDTETSLTLVYSF